MICCRKYRYFHYLFMAWVSEGQTEMFGISFISGEKDHWNFGLTMLLFYAICYVTWTGIQELLVCVSMRFWQNSFKRKTKLWEAIERGRKRRTRENKRDNIVMNSNVCRSSFSSRLSALSIVQTAKTHTDSFHTLHMVSMDMISSSYLMVIWPVI